MNAQWRMDTVLEMQSIRYQVTQLNENIAIQSAELLISAQRWPSKRFIDCKGIPYLEFLTPTPQSIREKIVAAYMEIEDLVIQRDLIIARGNAIQRPY